MDDYKREPAYRKSDQIWRIVLFCLGIIISVVMAFQGIVITIGTAVLGWTINRVQEAHESIAKLNVRIVTIENTRFTNEDGLTLWNKMSEMERRIPSKIPPVWFEKEVNDLKAEQKVHDSRLDRLERMNTQK